MGEKSLDVDGQWERGSSKLDNFHGRRICIVYKCLVETPSSKNRDRTERN